MDSGKESWSKCFWGDIFITKYVNGSIMWPGDYHIMSYLLLKIKIATKIHAMKKCNIFSKSYFVLWRIAKELTLILSILCEDTTKSFWFPFLRYFVLLVQNFNTINSSKSNQDKNRFFFEEKKKSSLACRALIRFFSNDTNALNITLKMISHDHLRRNHENCTFGGKRSCANAAVLRGI